MGLRWCLISVVRWLLPETNIGSQAQIALIAPLFERLQTLMIGHVGSIFVCVFALFRVDRRWAAAALIADVTLMLARCIVVVVARRQRRRIGDLALLRAQPFFHAVGLLWALVGGLFAGLCFVYGDDDIMRMMSVTLAFGIASGIGARNFGTVRVAVTQICGWLLPICVAAAFCGASYIALSCMTMLYIVAVYSFTRQNYSSMIKHLETLQTLHDSESELRAIFTNLTVGLNETEPVSGRFTRANPEFCRIVGRSEAELLGGLTVADITHPEDHARLRLSVILAETENISKMEREKRYVRPDGTHVWARVNGTFVEPTHPSRPARFVTVVSDLTAHMAAEAALAEKDAMLRLSMQAGHIGCFQRNPRTGDIDCDAETRRMHGWPQNDQPVPWSDWLAVVLPEDVARMQQETEGVHARQEAEYCYAYRIRHPDDGSLRYIEVRARTEYDDSGRPSHAVGVAIDVTERRQAEARIEHLAHHDPLTNLPNRALFQMRLDVALAQARCGEGFTLFYLDLDRFKDVNDTLGHPVGDLLLQSVTARLCSEVSEQDMVARLGGDEFVVIVSAQQSEGAAVALAQRLVQRLGEPFDLDGHHVLVGASLGMATAPDDGTDAEQLLKNADLALYRAKHSGGGRICRFEADMDLQMVARWALATDLRAALERGQFALFYQPVVSIRTRKAASFEALIRWIHPERGFIAPDQFIPLAESNGLIVAIDQWVLREACEQAARWSGRQRVAVNVSAVSFSSPNLVDNVAAALRESGLAPERLVLELTETVMLQDAELALTTLQSLKALGVRIALDDFGTGFASLSYLQRFPFDKVKIDRAFIAELGQRSQSSTIVRAVIDLCAALGMDTVAEGVETEEQFQALTMHNCDYVQGYLISRPLPTEQLAAFFRGPWGNGPVEVGQCSETQAA